MKKILPVVVITLVVSILGYFIYSSSKSASRPTPQSDTSSQLTPTPTNENKGVGNLFSIMSKNQQLECTWNIKEPVETKGKMWTSNNMARTQVNVQQNGLNMEANSIAKEGKVYVWSSISGVGNFGYMFDQNDTSAFSNDLSPEQKQQAAYLNDKVEYDCKPWSEDQSKFQVPSDVKFN